MIEKLEIGVQFVGLIQQAIPVVCQLLGSKTTTDVTESISFFVTAKGFEIENSQVNLLYLFFFKKN